MSIDLAKHRSAAFGLRQPGYLAVAAGLAAAQLCAALPAAADDPATLCGVAGGAPIEVQARVVAAQTPEVFRDKDFVAYQDKETFTMWTFTQPGHPAHPTVVCRRPVHNGDSITLEMGIVCKSSEKACQDIRQEFNALNAQMQQAIVNGEGKKPE